MVRLTHLGGPTVLIEVDGWRILTDPTFDPPGRTYRFGLGTSSTKTIGPALEPDDLGPIDLVLLSHDHHADNLDDRGRLTLNRATTVLTTVPGARRLRGSNVRGLRAGTQVELAGRDGGPALRVRATPCRHGPPLSRPVVGEVIGFALSLGQEGRVALWMTGDTVLHRPLKRTAAGLEVDVLLMHLGSVQFPITGPLRYSMNGADAIRLVRTVRPRVAVPVHYDGWSHFSEPPRRLHDVLDGLGGPDGPVVKWLEPGVLQDL
jgi:L-ascorbate metabolism protein UlaG (beta-lactamase superfamily)